MFSLTSTITTSALRQTSARWLAEGPKLKKPCLSMGETCMQATFTGSAMSR